MYFRRNLDKECCQFSLAKAAFGPSNQLTILQAQQSQHRELP
jgi:hypothetical protein